MLIEYRVSNYKSIREEQCFSLVASKDKRHPENVIKKDLLGMKNTSYLKGAAVYGANASGKSTLLNSLKFMQEFVLTSATYIRPDQETGVVPFLLDNDSSRQASSFEVTFVKDGVRYQYGFSLTSDHVEEEYLIAYPKGLAQKWFHRQRNYKTINPSYEWSHSTHFKLDSSLKDKTRSNALFVSVGAQWNNKQLTEIYEWFAHQLKFIGLSCFRRLSPDFTIDMLEKGGEASDKIKALMSEADFGIKDIVVNQVASVKRVAKQDAHINHENISLVDIEFKHKGGMISKEDESAGTQRFFDMVGPWLNIIENGHTAFIDELDTSLHPLLVRQILKLLFSDKHNQSGAQVIFSTHNPTLLDNELLRRDQFWFTEKGNDEATHLYPLTDFSPRNSEALAKGYLAGRFGAIPFLEGGFELEKD